MVFVERNVMKFKVGDIVFWSDPDDGLSSKFNSISSISESGVITLDDGTECFEHECSYSKLRVIHLSSDEVNYGVLEERTIPIHDCHALSVTFDGEDEPRCSFGIVIPENETNKSIIELLIQRGEDPYLYFKKMLQFNRFFDCLRLNGSDSVTETFFKMC